MPKSFDLKYKYVIILVIVLWQFKYLYDTNQPRVNSKTTQLHATSTVWQTLGSLVGMSEKGSGK